MANSTVSILVNWRQCIFGRFQENPEMLELSDTQVFFPNFSGAATNFFSFFIIHCYSWWCGSRWEKLQPFFVVNDKYTKPRKSGWLALSKAFIFPWRTHTFEQTEQLDESLPRMLWFRFCKGVHQSDALLQSNFRNQLSKNNLGRIFRRHVAQSIRLILLDRRIQHAN